MIFNCVVQLKIVKLNELKIYMYLSVTYLLLLLFEYVKMPRWQLMFMV